MSAPGGALEVPAPTTRRRGGLVRGGVVTAVGAVAGAALGFALTVVLARGLGAAGSGLLLAATAALGVAGVAGRLGGDTALVRELAALLALGRARDVRRTVVLAVVPVAVVTGAAALLALALAEPLAAVVLGSDAPAARDLVRVLALVLPAAALSMVLVGACRGLGDVLPVVAVEQVGKPLLRVAACAGVLAAGAGVVGASVAWAVPVLLGCGLAALLLRRDLPPVPAAAPPVRPWRELATPLWRFSLPRGAAATVEALGVAVGVLLVNVLAGAAPAGLLAGVLRFALVGTLALQAVRLVVAPRLSASLATGDVAGAQRLHSATTWAVLAVSGPAYVLLAVHAAPALGLLGPEFRAGAGALAVLCAAMLVNVATGNVQAVLLMSGRSGTALAVVVGGLALHVVLALVLVPRAGVLGAAVAAGAVVVLENLAVLAVVRRTTGITTLDPPVRRLLVAVLLAVALPGAVLHAVGPTAVATAVASLVSLVLYAGALVLLRADAPTDALRAALPGRRGAADPQPGDDDVAPVPGGQP